MSVAARLRSGDGCAYSSSKFCYAVRRDARRGAGMLRVTVIAAATATDRDIGASAFARACACACTCV